MSRQRSAWFPMALMLLFALPMLADDGPTLFKSKCVMCHGADGTGATTMGKKFGIRSFASPDVQKQTDAVLTTTIKNGKGKMPAYGGKLTDADIKALVAHIRSFAKK